MYTAYTSYTSGPLYGSPLSARFALFSPSVHKIVIYSRWDFNYCGFIANKFSYKLGKRKVWTVKGARSRSQSFMVKEPQQRKRNPWKGLRHVLAVKSIGFALPTPRTHPTPALASLACLAQCPIIAILSQRVGLGCGRCTLLWVNHTNIFANSQQLKSHRMHLKHPKQTAANKTQSLLTQL